MDKVRIDKWLWSVRIYKSRTQATTACKSGKISVNEEIVKPSFNLLPDQLVTVRKDGFNFQFKALKLINKRVSASLAAECYEDHTPEDELNKFKKWFIGKAGAEWRERGDGRPTKKQRRIIDDYKESVFDSYL